VVTKPGKKRSINHFYRKANFVFRIACLFFLQNLLPGKGNSQTTPGWYCNICGAGPFSSYAEGQQHIRSEHYYKGAVVITTENTEAAEIIRKKIEQRMGKLQSDPKKPIVIWNAEDPATISNRVKKALHNSANSPHIWSSVEDEVVIGGKG
jgi:hypothetical protein